MKYICRQFMIDAYRLTDQADPVPSWLARPQFARVLKDGGGISHGLLYNPATDKTTTVEVGDWIVNDRDVLSRYTDKDFKNKYAPAAEPTPQIEMFEPDPELEDDDDDVEWFDYDSNKPAAMISVVDHVFIELLKARLSNSSETWENITSNHIEIVDWALDSMNYDAP